MPQENNKLKNKSIVLTDEESEAAELNFDRHRKALEKSIYTSRYDEKTRYINLNSSWTITSLNPNIMYDFIETVLKDFHSRIDIENVKSGSYLRGGSKAKHKVIHVKELIMDDEKKAMVITEWFTDESFITRKIVIKKKMFGANKYKIVLSETVKGNKGLIGLQGTYIRRRYIKQRVLQFKMSMANFELEHCEITDKRIYALERKKIRLKKLFAI